MFWWQHLHFSWVSRKSDRILCIANRLGLAGFQAVMVYLLVLFVSVVAIHS